MKISILTYSDARGQEFKNMEGVDTEFAVANILDLAATCQSLNIPCKKDFYWKNVSFNQKGDAREVPPNPVIEITINSKEGRLEFLPEETIIDSLKLMSNIAKINNIANFSDDFISSIDDFGKPITQFCASAYFLEREIEDGWKSGNPSEKFLQEMEIFKSFYPRLQKNGWDIAPIPEKQKFKGEIYYG